MGKTVMERLDKRQRRRAEILKKCAGVVRRVFNPATPDEMLLYVKQIIDDYLDFDEEAEYEPGDEDAFDFDIFEKELAEAVEVAIETFGESKPTFEMALLAHDLVIVEAEAEE